MRSNYMRSFEHDARQNAWLRFVTTVDKPRCPEDLSMLLQ